MLIKFVITAILTYMMSIFKLPKIWCKEINALITGFWWGQTGESRKIHWKKWDDLEKTKEDGGLGFRELEIFNISLLTKMGDGVNTEPDSLLVKVVK